jgi:phasin family protein
MATKPESRTDLFTRLGQDLKIPRVDVDAILDHHRKNLDALQKSASAAASGASTLMSRQGQMLQEILHEIADAAQTLQKPGSSGEFMSKQAELARKSFEAAVKNAGDTAKIMRKSGGESVDILRARMRESLEEMRNSYEKRK